MPQPGTSMLAPAPPSTVHPSRLWLRQTQIPIGLIFAVAIGLRLYQLDTLYSAYGDAVYTRFSVDSPN